MSRRRSVKPVVPPEPRWLKVGDVVDYHAMIGGPVTQAGMVVRAGPQLLMGHTWVVWLHGKAGCVAVDAVTKPVDGLKDGS